MRSKSYKGMACSIAGALEAIGDRWAFLILRDLSLGLTRYDEFQTSTGIPPNTLADRLKSLQASGLVERRLYNERPPRFEYILSEKGRDLWLVTVALLQWGDRWDASGKGAPPVELHDIQTGRQPVLAMVDPETGEIVPRQRIVARAGRGADDIARWRVDARRTRELETTED
ncbi:helix-turn-helix transcriptional regulator [Rhizobiales bacterium]|uniref:winged helix-turn-helix transcriptional regulator n=1 Tax=Hongsoonwoonella zoysiae TaxID=2821844 RepID=UPI0015602856|nr:helix-turn-helix domain-containing protein [Hongsoonwoonella zoysiae]NRG16405.1 helix-turn-helix transcriptional regulator [Hongsoonwoonella zoysiae]